MGQEGLGIVPDGFMETKKKHKGGASKDRQVLAQPDSHIPLPPVPTPR